MRLRTAHKRRTRRDRQRLFPLPALRRLALCNRYAASDKCTHLHKSGIYMIKDLILHHFGTVTGYAEQHWTSGYHDYDDDYFDPKACHHHHILKCVELRGRVFHVPTGEFNFDNYLTDYGKRSPLFNFYKRHLVTSKIEGKKKITANVPEWPAVRYAYNWLVRHYGDLPHVPDKPRHLIEGTPERVAYLRYKQEQENRKRQEYTEFQARLAAKRIECLWCKKVKTGLDYGGHENNWHVQICNDCAPIVELSAKGRQMVAALVGEIPF